MIKNSLLLVAMAAMPAFAQATISPQSCLVVNNATSTGPISVLVDGYGEHFWAIPPNTTVTLTNGDGGPALRAVGFKISIFSGDQGSRGQLLDNSTGMYTGYGYGSTPHTLWTPIGSSATDGRAQPECRGTGFWPALFHN